MPYLGQDYVHGVETLNPKPLNPPSILFIPVIRPIVINYYFISSSYCYLIPSNSSFCVMGCSIVRSPLETRGDRKHKRHATKHCTLHRHSLSRNCPRNWVIPPRYRQGAERGIKQPQRASATWLDELAGGKHCRDEHTVLPRFRALLGR